MPLKKETRHAIIASVIALILVLAWAYWGARADEKTFGISFALTFSAILTVGALIIAIVFFLTRVISRDMRDPYGGM